MFPVKDDNPTSTVPWVTYGIIILNLLVFGYEMSLSLDEKALINFFDTYGLIPEKIVNGQSLFSLFTSMFIHGGFMHIFGNMLYLYIFGNNIEDIMGHRRFILFYLLCGMAASGLQISINPHSTVPNIGASGAIAGVLGAYLLTFPGAKVHTLIFFGYFVRWVKLPALFVLGFWFIIQLFSGIGSLGYMTADAGGIAFFAHIGGFVAGALLVLIFNKKKRRFLGM
ncbi:MAG: rhomboid family intramembrane serine protease [Candidatus Altiarchaeales archaeon]|nr:MAG: rhomboid family intramembrane serine protease [Candidatus Altiarchaeales archaeon]